MPNDDIEWRPLPNDSLAVMDGGPLEQVEWDRRAASRCKEEVLLRSVRGTLRVFDIVGGINADEVPVSLLIAIEAVRAACLDSLKDALPTEARDDLPVESRFTVDHWNIDLLVSYAETFSEVPKFQKRLLEATRDADIWATEETRELARAIRRCTDNAELFLYFARALRSDHRPLPREHGFFATAWREIVDVATTCQVVTPAWKEWIGRGFAAQTFLVTATRVGFADAPQLTYVDAFVAFLYAVRNNHFNPSVVAREALRVLGWDPARFSASERQLPPEERPSRRTANKRPQPSQPRKKGKSLRKDTPPEERPSKRTTKKRAQPSQPRKKGKSPRKDTTRPKHSRPRL